jgi:hypothetical protein
MKKSIDKKKLKLGQEHIRVLSALQLLNAVGGVDNTSQGINKCTNGCQPTDGGCNTGTVRCPP